MSKRRGHRGPRPSLPPADAESAAAAVRKYMIGLFEREDGKAADWPLIAETLFKVAFGALDEAGPGNARTAALLRRVHDGAYNRIVRNMDEAGDLGPENPTAQPGAEPPRLPRQHFTP